MSYSGNLSVENRNGLIVDAEVFQANGTARARRGPSDAGAGSGNEGGNRGRRQRIRHARFREGVSAFALISTGLPQLLPAF